MKALFWALNCLCLVILYGCASAPPAPAPTPEPAPKVPELSAEEKRQLNIQRLLYSAERALAKDRLLSPAYDNAYDRYASVQLLEPGNAEAKMGMQAIVLRYLDMARDAAERSYFNEAHQYLGRAASILPQDMAVQSLVQQQRELLATPEPRMAADNAVMLDGRDLARRNQDIEQQLAELALRAREDDAMVLIVAGSDGEGRWVYQTMRKAVPGYLLRGDIQVGSPARIELLPPLQ